MKKFEIVVDDEHNEACLRRAMNADQAYGALWDTIQEVFRPARKHGYSDERLRMLVEKCGEAGVELIQALEDKFSFILQENGIDFDRDWA